MRLPKDLLSLTFLSLMEPVGTLSFGRWIIATDPSFFTGNQKLKQYIYMRAGVNGLDRLSVSVNASLLLIITKNPGTNYAYAQVFANNSVNNGHNTCKLYAYCLYRYMTFLIKICEFSQPALMFWRASPFRNFCLLSLPF